jgi:DnaJ domain
VQIPGRLSETTLGDVLGALLRARVTGLVRLRETQAHSADREHRVYLSRGEVIAVETEARVPVLGEILMQHGLLDATAQRRLRQRLTAGASGLVGDVLVEEGYVSREVIGAALRKQLRSKLDMLFQIREGALSFHVACVTPRCPVAPLSPREFLRGRPRARDRMGNGPFRAEARRPSATDHRVEHALSLLGLDESASTAEVRKAFRQLATRLHPDRHMHATEAERRAMAERFAALSAAYHTVMG